MHRLILLGIISGINSGINSEINLVGNYFSELIRELNLDLIHLESNEYHLGANQASTPRQASPARRASKQSLCTIYGFQWLSYEILRTSHGIHLGSNGHHLDANQASTARRASPVRQGSSAYGT